MKKESKQVTNCKKCNILFCFYDSKTQRTNNRKYCFTCSPKKSKEEKQYLLENNLGYCRHCNETKDASFFYSPIKTTCKECHSKRQIQLEYERKQFCVDYKGGKCSKCGYNQSLAALDFHHLDPSKKDINIADLKRSPKLKNSKLLEELDKCILLCSNCHRELHSKESSYKLKGFVFNEKYLPRVN